MFELWIKNDDTEFVLYIWSDSLPIIRQYQQIEVSFGFETEIRISEVKAV